MANSVFHSFVPMAVVQVFLSNDTFTSESDDNPLSLAFPLNVNGLVLSSSAFGYTSIDVNSGFVASTVKLLVASALLPALS